MSPTPPIPPFFALRPLDLSGVDAIGFDLDHTLALYNDDAINAIAADATRALLVERLGYPAWVADPVDLAPMEPAARALAVDLQEGAVVKLDAERRVRRARRDGRWLDGPDVARRFARAIPDTAEAAYHVYSPFDLPTLRLFESLTADERFSPRPAPAQLCGDIRRMLDTAHTNGTLKARIVERLESMVSPTPGLDALAAWTRAGKRLFVVTNSEADYATAVLDRVMGDAWREYFDVVAASSRKPAFFDDAAPSSVMPATLSSRPRVVEHASARDIQEMLGTIRSRVLYVGDNANADIRPARRYGWRTAHVVPEIAATSALNEQAWGGPLDEDGEPTWLMRLIHDHADVVCDRVDRLLALAPDARVAPPA